MLDVGFFSDDDGRGDRFIDAKDADPTPRLLCASGDGADDAIPRPLLMSLLLLLLLWSRRR